MIKRQNLTNILGIDPGTRVIGYALVKKNLPAAIHPKQHSILEAGVIKMNATKPLSERIGDMHEALYKICLRLNPDVCVMEEAFFGINPQSTIKLGQARGALISAASRHNIPLEELTPTQIKKIVTGNGRATKQLVSDSLESLMGFKRGKLPFDATDAIAIALSYAVSQVSNFKHRP